MTEPVVPWELSLLRHGLKLAYERCAEADRPGSFPDPIRAPLAAGEFVGYACALDEWLSVQQNSGYAHRRDQDADGRLLIGMRFARDRNAHQATLTAVTAFTLQWSEDAEGNRRETVLHPGEFAWRDLVDVTEPTGGRETTPLYLRRRAAYEADLSGRRALPILDSALRFLTEELRAHGVE